MRYSFKNRYNCLYFSHTYINSIFTDYQPVNELFYSRFSVSVEYFIRNNKKKNLFISW